MLELEPEDIGALYSRAFLLEREGRLAEAADAWRSIIEWNEARGFTLQIRVAEARARAVGGRQPGRLALGAKHCANQRHPEPAIGTQSRAASCGQPIQPPGAVTRAAQQTSLLAAV